MTSDAVTGAAELPIKMSDVVCEFAVIEMVPLVNVRRSDAGVAAANVRLYALFTENTSWSPAAGSWAGFQFAMVAVEPPAGLFQLSTAAFDAEAMPASEAKMSGRRMGAFMTGFSLSDGQRHPAANGRGWKWPFLMFNASEQTSTGHKIAREPHNVARAAPDCGS